MRTCQQCKIKMPPFAPRTRHPETGALVCNGCHPDKPGSEGRPVGHHGSIETLSCAACSAPMGDAGLIRIAGLLRCADGCKTAGITPAPDAAGHSFGGEDPNEKDYEDCPRCEGTGFKPSTSGATDRTCGECNGRGEVKTGSRKTTAPCGQMALGSLKKQAHDSGDGQTIYHCPFCGAGQTVARSDGTVECGFCQTHFTVQVQPEHASMPQTDPATGQPLNMPGMPGDPAQHQAPVPTPTNTTGPQGEGGFAPAGSGGTEGFAPAGSGPQEGFAPAGSARAASRRTAADREPGGDTLTPKDASKRRSKTAAMSDLDDATLHNEERNWSAKLNNARTPDAIEMVNAYLKQLREEIARRASKTSAMFLTPDQVALPEPSFLAHLAIRFADDREAVVQQVRNERAPR